MYERLNEILKERKMSKAELARRSGLHLNTIHHIKHGEITLTSAIKIANALNVSLDEFRKEVRGCS